MTNIRSFKKQKRNSNELKIKRFGIKHFGIFMVLILTIFGLTAQTNSAKVNTNGEFPNNLLKMRSSPSTSNNDNFVIAIPKGESVEIIEKNVKADNINGSYGYWFKVRYAGKGYDKSAKNSTNGTWVGYVWGNFLKLSVNQNSGLSQNSQSNQNNNKNSNSSNACLVCHGTGKVKFEKPTEGTCVLCGGKGYYYSLGGYYNNCEMCALYAERTCNACSGTGLNLSNPTPTPIPTPTPTPNYNSKCGLCNGTGKHQLCNGTGRHMCKNCNGTGQRYNTYTNLYERCSNPTCSGGYTRCSCYNGQCGACNGSGIK